MKRTPLARKTPLKATTIRASGKRKAGCDCETCRPNVLGDMRMILCAICGNKRCPHATDHRNACTGSNDVGQSGSSWEHVKPVTKRMKSSRPKMTPARASGKRKARSKATKAHMSRVAEIGCIACLIAGTPGTPPELHHPRTDAGAGQKAPDTDVIPLCHAHHRGTQHPKVPSIHLDRLKFIETFGSEAELLEMVRRQITAVNS